MTVAITRHAGTQHMECGDSAPPLTPQPRPAVAAHHTVVHATSNFQIQTTVSMDLTR